jgi:hypothetical protein
LELDLLPIGADGPQLNTDEARIAPAEAPIGAILPAGTRTVGSASPPGWTLISAEWLPALGCKGPLHANRGSSRNPELARELRMFV